MEDIARYAEPLIMEENTELTSSTNIDNLFKKLQPYYDFLDCDIIRDIAIKYIEDSNIVTGIEQHVKNATTFIESKPITILMKDLNKIMEHKPLIEGAQLSLKISRKWGKRSIKCLHTLINYLLPQPYPKMSLFKYVNIVKSSISIQYVVLQSYVEAHHISC